jgi:hypothetical protein
MDDLGNRDKNRQNPRGNERNVGRTNEALRLGYLLLWNFADRLAYGNSKELDQDFYKNLIVFKVDWSDNGLDKSLSHEKLMLEVRHELNYYINGAPYPEKSHFRNLAIQDPNFLDAIADTFGGFDGIVGFILAGNDMCSSELLAQLIDGKYSIPGTMDSTRQRAQELLDSRL